MDRILRGTTATIATTLYASGSATDPSPDTATVQILRADGTELVTSAPAQNAGIGVFTFDLTVAHTSLLDQPTVRWTATYDGEPQTIETHLEIVGGFLCPLVRLRAALPDTDDAELARIRTEAEQEIERACGKAFVPRYALETLARSVTRLHTRPYLRAVRSLALAGTAYTTDQIAALTLTPFPGVIGGLDRCAAAAAVVGYEYGLDFPPEKIARAVELYALETYDPDAPDSRIIRQEADNMAVTFANPAGGWFVTPELNQIISDHALPPLPTLV